MFPVTGRVGKSFIKYQYFMKIMHVGQMIGGLDVYIRNSITNCKDDTMEFVIVCGKDDKHEPVMRNGKAVKEHHISLYRSLNPVHDLIGLMQVIKCIVAEKPDIIHCHSAKGGMFGRVAGWLTGVRTLYTPHAFSYLSTASKGKRKVFLEMERRTKLGTYLLACSESERQMGMREVGYRPDHALAWHNAVPDALPAVKTVDTTEPFACYIGRPCYQKNTLFLADVIERVKKKGCPLKFMLLGVGYYSSDLDELKRKIAEKGLEDVITLEPWISHEACLGYLKKSLFYLTTSLYEGLPLSVIEAMSLGKAVVASDVVGNRDCVSNGKNGYLLPLDAETFADKIVELWNDRDKRETFERNSRELFLREFLIDRQIDKLHDIYISIYDGHDNRKELRH